MSRRNESEDVEEEEVKEEEEEEEDSTTSSVVECEAPKGKASATSENDAKKSFLQGLSLLSKVPSAVCCGGEALKLGNPGLCAKGRLLTLPITKEDATFLRQQGKLSAFGKGMDTVVDPAVRSSYEFDAKDVRFDNPVWNDCVKEVVVGAVDDLVGATKTKQKNLCDRVGFSLWKLLYYPQGTFFKPHQDTEKVRNMFATLVITLPSSYRGGELVCSQSGVDTVFTFAGKDGRGETEQDIRGREFTAHYTAFYADVTHEVRPLTSGDRIVLTYNVFWKSKQDVPAVSLSHIDKVVCHFAAGLKTTKDPYYFGLAHDYTDASVTSLGLGCLKGIDRKLLVALRGAIDGLKEGQQPVGLFLVRREREIISCGDGCGPGLANWYDDGGSEGSEEEEERYEEFEEFEEIERNETEEWHAPYGAKVETGITVSEEHICLLPGLDSVFPKKWMEETVEGYQGNAGPDKTQVYHEWCLAVVPSQKMKKDVGKKGWRFAAVMLSSCSPRSPMVTNDRLHSIIERAARSNGDEIDEHAFPVLLGYRNRLSIGELATVLRAQESLQPACVPVVQSYSHQPEVTVLVNALKGVATKRPGTNDAVVALALQDESLLLTVAEAAINAENPNSDVPELLKVFATRRCGTARVVGEICRCHCWTLSIVRGIQIGGSSPQETYSVVVRHRRRC